MIWLFIIPFIIFVLILLMIEVVKDWNDRARHEETMNLYKEHYANEYEKKNRK